MSLAEQKTWASNWARNLFLVAIEEARGGIAARIRICAEEAMQQCGLLVAFHNREHLASQIRDLQQQDRVLQRHILAHIQGVDPSEVCLGIGQDEAIDEWKEAQGLARFREQASSRSSEDSRLLAQLSQFEELLASIPSSMNSIASQSGLRAWRKKVFEILYIDPTELESVALSPPPTSCTVVHHGQDVG